MNNVPHAAPNGHFRMITVIIGVVGLLLVLFERYTAMIRELTEIRIAVERNTESRIRTDTALLNFTIRVDRVVRDLDGRLDRVETRLGPPRTP